MPTCSCKVRDYVYGTWWRCRACGKWWERVSLPGTFTRGEWLRHEANETTISII